MGVRFPLPAHNRGGSIKKIIFFVIEASLIIGILLGESLKYISDESASELVGDNTWSLITIFGGGYLVYLSAKK